MAVANRTKRNYSSILSRELHIAIVPKSNVEIRASRTWSWYEQPDGQKKVHSHKYINSGFLPHCQLSIIKELSFGILVCCAVLGFEE